MRYVLKFYKEGTIRYISHLDLLRLFKRSFKRTGIKLEHSKGYNPHPKMSFAQPLSLGYSSKSEYLEFETIETYDGQEIKEKLNAILPPGLGVLECKIMDSGKKSLAALIKSADYEIQIPWKNPIDISKIIEEYMTQDHIYVDKLNRKTGKIKEVEIKSMIKEMKGEAHDNEIILTARLSAGSMSNLSPEMLLSSFCQYAGIPYDRADINITRLEIHFNG
ncbi:MAG: TIGR03936 family radical SAM-associated protein [Anaerovoracaceae bacterium]|jgi:radical SAM-linked protein